MTRAVLVSAPPPLPPPSVRRTVRRRLLCWYDRHARDLPWRRTPGDPYAQWVAEIMLQQTQVDTVIPYYERFMQQFPDVATLARATGDRLMRCWQGLGYYRRAENLHRAAALIVADGGNMPHTVDALRALPGVGRYTAGAVASIACGARTAAVDGNVARVLCRLFNITETVSEPGTIRRLWSLAESLLPARRCGDFNQAWMDLGAAVCTPTAPRCARCPLETLCAARKTGNPAALPRKPRARPVPEIRHVAAVIRNRTAYLMTRRPPGGLWSGLWEFPNRVVPPRQAPRTVLRRILTRFGVGDDHECHRCGTVAHKLTHRLMVFDTFLIVVTRPGTKTPADPETRWVPAARLDALPMSTACRRILARAR